jgi:DNA-binding protein YbaB
MKDIMGMMKAAQEMQGRMQDMQSQIAQMTVEGRSGAGMVVVTLSGKGGCAASSSPLIFNTGQDGVRAQVPRD